MDEKIENKIEASGLVTIDLEDLYPAGERVLFDIKNLLFQELILKEKDFRAYIQQEDWSKYKDKFIALTCTADAIVPTWAYMLLSIALEPYAKKIIFGNLETLETILYSQAFSEMNVQQFKDARVVIKGCGKLPVPKNAYVELAAILKPIVKSLMYGEPCSTVPLYKEKKNK